MRPCRVKNVLFCLSFASKINSFEFSYGGNFGIWNFDHRQLFLSLFLCLCHFLSLPSQPSLSVVLINKILTYSTFLFFLYLILCFLHMFRPTYLWTISQFAFLCSYIVSICPYPRVPHLYLLICTSCLLFVISFFLCWSWRNWTADNLIRPQSSVARRRCINHFLTAPTSNFCLHNDYRRHASFNPAPSHNYPTPFCIPLRSSCSLPKVWLGKWKPMGRSSS